MNSDLLVLGAGPAGFAISYLMAKRGYSVEVLDPAFFPRPKICGEFLNPQAVQWLKSQDLIDPLLRLNPFPVRGMKITDGMGRSFTGHYFPRGEGNGYAVMRKDFDALLLEEARKSGIIINEGFRAERLILENYRAVGVSGTDSTGEAFTKSARVIVGADGRNNLIGRTFGWMRGIRNLRKYAFSTYFRGLSDIQPFGEVHLVKDGYVGIAPLQPDLANVALVIDESRCPTGDVNLKDFLLKKIAESHLQPRFGALQPVSPVITAGPLAFRMKRVSGHGTLLVGDTCGFIDPFTGEGINYAFLSASLAAPVLDEALSTNNVDDSMLSRYDEARKGIFNRKFLMARLLQRAIGRPFLSTYLVRKFQRSLPLGDTIVSAVGSAIPVERVWNWRFLLKLMFA
jgi:flavin-dependent dehydrogenase